MKFPTFLLLPANGKRNLPESDDYNPFLMRKLWVLVNNLRHFHRGVAHNVPLYVCACHFSLSLCLYLLCAPRAFVLSSRDSGEKDEHTIRIFSRNSKSRPHRRKRHTLQAQQTHTRTHFHTQTVSKYSNKLFIRVTMHRY